MIVKIQLIADNGKIISESMHDALNQFEVSFSNAPGCAPRQGELLLYGLRVEPVVSQLKFIGLEEKP